MSRLSLLVVAVSLAAAASAPGQQIHRNNFENNKLFWSKSIFDAQHEVLLHVNTDQGAHSDQRSEYLQLRVQPGKYLYYQYPVGKAPINEELAASFWLKANRPGLQLLARVVAPRERDLKNLEAPLTTLIHGDVYQNAGRWQRVSINRPVELAKKQQQLLQAQTMKALDFTDAYIDSLVLNVYAGPGPTELWIDDLEVGPVLVDVVKAPIPATPTSTNAANATPNARPVSVRPDVVFNGNQLLVGGRPFFMRGIRVTDTPLKVLQQAGFNTVFLEPNADPALYREASELGLWIVPSLPVLTDDPRFTSPDGLAREAQVLSEKDGVLFLHLGRGLQSEQVAPFQRAAQILRQADPTRALGADVWDGLKQYSQSLNMVDLHRWPLMTSLELPRYRDWVEMRRRLLNNPGIYTWSWIQTHVPDWDAQLLYGQVGTQAFTEPIGPQPEQIRLLAYSAVAGGAKGIAFWSDRFLADSHMGRDRLLMCATINQELEMLEPILSGVNETPQWIDTRTPEIKAAILRSPKGIIALPMWHGGGAQFVPGQAAVAKLTIVVPQVPGSMQAWEVLPGDVRSIKTRRVPGGTEITIHEFGLTSAIVFTSDTNLVVRFQEQNRSKRQLAAQWTYDMANYSLEKILAVDQQLQSRGVSLPDDAQLAQDARNRLESAKKLWDAKLYSEAYRESQRALRPLRILMRGHWEKAIKDLDSPVSSPYAVSYFTLPKHWDFMAQVKAAAPTTNILTGGDFESPPTDAKGWKVDEKSLDDVEMICIRVKEIQTNLEMKPGGTPSMIEHPKEGDQCAMLQIKPRNHTEPPLALERAELGLISPTVKLAPGTLVRISAWVRIPTAITASVDGALLYDTAGGEPLAIRFTDPTPWKKVTIYRRVPSSGEIGVNLVLTGIGTVYFDDVRIEPLSTSPDVPVIPVSGTR
jgi:hypothetical protein